MSETIAARLAEFATSAGAGDIPGDVRAGGRLHLLDALGCGLAAVGTGAGAAASAVARAQGGARESSLLGDVTPVPAAMAALANGTRFHALDFDDTHERGICHSSAVVGPAALAVGEARDASLQAVLDAYVLGSEVALRIAVASADGLYARGFHPTGVCGAFGAAAAAARLFGMGPAETGNALGVVGSFAAGLFEYLSDGSATKPLHAGWAAQAGIQAAQLARAGATGPATVIEGRFGLLSSHVGSAETAASVGDGLGARWEVMGLSIKPYPACHFVHSSTWAAAELAREHELAIEDIAEIVVSIPEEGAPLVLVPPAEKARPRTPYDAKFSLPFTVAHRLVNGVLGVDSFTDEAISDERVLDLAGRVRSEPLAGPAPSRFAGGVRLITQSGGRFDRLIEAVPGSPENPLNDEWVAAKFRTNAQLALTSRGVDRLVALLASPDERDALAELTATLREARPENA